MIYRSTRGSPEAYTFSQAVLMGLASDGGLLVPDEYPELQLSQILEWSDLSYSQLVARILHLFGPEIPLRDLESITDQAYNHSGWTSQSHVPHTHLWGRTHILDLSRGPTGAFKDYALQLLPLLSDYCQRQENAQQQCILVATSGDTGGAALAGYAHVPQTQVICLYPHGRVSALQEAQMLRLPGENLISVSVNEDFDTAQRALKSVFQNEFFSEALKSEHNMALSSANSINIGRLLPQVAYYVASYLSARERGELQDGESMRVVVPSGNFGNMFAGVIARKLGVPISQFVAATNVNRTLSDFFQEGVLRKPESSEQTVAPAMDIMVPSNLERLIALSIQDPGTLRELYSELEHEKQTSLAGEWPQELYRGLSATDEQILQSIRMTHEETRILLDPHTAIGVLGAREVEDDTYTLVLGTAHPEKFSPTVLAALGQTSEDGGGLRDIELLDRLGGKSARHASLREVFGLPIRHHPYGCPSTEGAIEDLIRDVLAQRYE